MVAMEKLRDIVLDVLRERFDDVAIENIDIQRDRDEDGNDILRVQVVFDGNTKRLDARKASSVQRYMRPRLAEIQETAFPVMSYISKSDYRKHKAAAA